MYDFFELIDKIAVHIYSIMMICIYKIKYGRRLKIGKKVIFRRRIIIRIHKEGYLEIGNDNFFNSNCSINVLKKVIIGDNNRFGESVHIYDHNHRINQGNWNDYTTSDVSIGNNNWICTNCVILKGGKIGNNSVIGVAGIINEIVDNDVICFNNKIIKKDEKNEF